MRSDLYRYRSYSADIPKFRMSENSVLPHHTTLSDGTPVVMRPLRAEDSAKLAEGLQNLSPKARYQRFLYGKHAFTPSELAYLSASDGLNHLVLGLALSNAEGAELKPIAVARCIRDEDAPSLAEVAIVVADEWQGRGAGTILVRALAESAWKVGIRRWQALLLSDNSASFKLMEIAGTKLSQHSQSPGTTLITYTLRPPPDYIEESGSPHRTENRIESRGIAPKTLLLAAMVSVLMLLGYLLFSRKSILHEMGSN